MCCYTNQGISNPNQLRLHEAVWLTERTICLLSRHLSLCLIDHQQTFACSCLRLSEKYFVWNWRDRLTFLNLLEKTIIHFSLLDCYYKNFCTLIPASQTSRSCRNGIDLDAPLKLGRVPGGGVLPEKLSMVCGPLPETLTLFQTKTAKKLYLLGPHIPI